MKISKFLNFLFVLLLLFGFGYYYKEDIVRFYQNALSQVFLCQQPITYSIGSIDPRFGLTKEELISNISKAEKIWEAPINKQLFEYSTSADWRREIKINLIYDYRQKATDALKNIGITINSDQTTYNELKTKYDSFVASYNNQKAQLNEMIAAYNAEKTAYEKGKRNSNSQISDLNNQADTINQLEDSLNSLVDNINSLATSLNGLASQLNIQVNSYNTIGAGAGKEFNEGEYISDASGKTINIYQFNNTDQLVRVLAHELGHALGLGHLSNPKAIMYYLNEGVNEKLTADDLNALKTACRIK